jgi:hypothetical protein
MFLLVHLVDEHGRMGTAYRRVLRRASCDPGHWAHGRSLGGVRAEVGRWIGAAARPGSLPPWDLIADLVEAAVHPASVPDVLATARYLHALTNRGGDADSPFRPRWLDPVPENVTTAMVGGPEWARKHGLPLPETRLPEVTLQAAPLRMASPPEPPDPERGSYQLLWSVVRVHREAEVRYQARIAELEDEVRALREENTRLSGDVTSWLGGYQPTIPDQDRRTPTARPVADRHLALEDPVQTFTYPLPAELPEPRRVRG